MSPLQRTPYPLFSALSFPLFHTQIVVFKCSFSPKLFPPVFPSKYPNRPLTLNFSPDLPSTWILIPPGKHCKLKMVGVCSVGRIFPQVYCSLKAQLYIMSNVNTIQIVPIQQVNQGYLGAIVVTVIKQ